MRHLPYLDFFFYKVGKNGENNRDVSKEHEILYVSSILNIFAC